MRTCRTGAGAVAGGEDGAGVEQAEREVSEGATEAAREGIRRTEGGEGEGSVIIISNI